MGEPDQIPRLARPFAAAMIVLMIACAIFAWELWPFTSFRLFSTLRVDQQTAWSATTVDGAGKEDSYPLGAEDHGFRGFPFTMNEFAAATSQRQDDLCRIWVESAPELVGREATEVRIYQRSWTVSDRSGDEAVPGTTILRYICRESGASDAG